MANDGKIYITISDKRFGSNKAEADEQNKIDKEKDSKSVVADYAKHKFFNLIESQAKQAVNYTINNIGNFTGDYVKQTQVSEAMQILNTVVDLGTAAFAGFKATGSPYGALIAVGVSLIGKGISFGEDVYAGYVENKRINRDIAQLRTRAGLNSLNNNSRGTDQ